MTVDRGLQNEGRRVSEREETASRGEKRIWKDGERENEPVVQPSALRMASEFHRALSPVVVRLASGFRSDRNLLPSLLRPRSGRI